jgi:diketogulonate reductase-like aldo/keto reductase
MAKSATQVSLRWLIQQVIPVIPRTRWIEHLSENYAIFDFELSEAEISEISLTCARLANMMLALRVGFRISWHLVRKRPRYW